MATNLAGLLPLPFLFLLPEQKFNEQGEVTMVESIDAVAKQVPEGPGSESTRDRLPGADSKPEEEAVSKP